MPSAYQSAVLDFVSNGSGNALIQAVAGSGKTTTLLQVCERIKGRCVALMFNKKIQTEFDSRLKKAGISHVDAKTVHSLGFGAYRKRFGSVNISDTKVRDIVQASFASEDLKFYGSFVSKLVSLAKDAGFGIGGNFPAIGNSQAWLNLINHHDLDLDYDDASYDRAIELAQGVLKASNGDLKVIDFSDMVYLPLLTGTKLPTYDWVLVDECQDLSLLRQAMIRAVLPLSGRAVFVGDRGQAIYGFTGADANAMENIKSDFNATELPLSICYRCSKAVIDYVKPFYPTIEASESAVEGSVSSIEFKNLFEQTFTGSDAILCRNNAPLIKTAFRLIAKGVGCRIEGRDIGLSLIKLAKRWKVKSLNSLSDRLATYQERETQKLRAKGRDSAVASLEDKVECLRALIAKCQGDNQHSLEDLESLILRMFSDGNNNPNPNLVTLCSSHKSKGLEWERVFVLGRGDFMPSPWATKDWMKVQETNLIYVTLTRAKVSLVEVTGVKEGLVS